MDTEIQGILNNKPLIVPNDDAKTIKLIFEWYAKGKTQAEIHEQTKADGSEGL